MILFPAIDLKQGECVRLQQGDMSRATLYNSDPSAQARAFEEQGFRWLHVVDLDGAFAGESVNGDAVDSILSSTKNPIQLGGGIRNLSHISSWLERGVSRVILGTLAVRDPDLVCEACRQFPDKIAVGIDARNGKVAVEGWSQSSQCDAHELVKRFEDAGVSAVIYTDIERDGLLSGINWESTLSLAHSTSLSIIASGGLASMDDIRFLCSPDAKILEGAVCGRALYDGTIDSAQALSLLSSLGEV